MLEVMGYTQPAASDYDDWAHVHNNPGWSFKDLLPLIKKVRGFHGTAVMVLITRLYVQAETFHVASDDPSLGYDGPLKVSYRGTCTNIGEEYITTISQYDKTRAMVDEIVVPPLNHVHVMSNFLLDRPAALDMHPHTLFRSIGQSGSTGRPVAGPM